MSMRSNLFRKPLPNDLHMFRSLPTGIRTRDVSSPVYARGQLFDANDFRDHILELVALCLSFNTYFF